MFYWLCDIHILYSRVIIQDQTDNPVNDDKGDNDDRVDDFGSELN